MPRRPGSGFQEKVAAGRAADVSFVLGELTGAHPPWPGAGMHDETPRRAELSPTACSVSVPLNTS